MTKRCEQRVDWAENKLGSDEDSLWVCDLKQQCTSGSTTCRLYRELQAAKEERVEAEQAVVEAEEKLVEAKQAVVEAEEKLVEAKQALVREKEKLVEEKQVLVREEEKLVEEKQALVREEEKLAAPKEKLDEAILKLAKAEDELMNATRELLQARNESSLHGSEGALSAFVGLRKEMVDAKKEAVRDKEAAVRDKEELVDRQEAAVRGQEKAVRGQEKAVRGQEKAVRDKEAAVRDKEAAVRDKEAAVRGKEATVRDKEAAVRGKEATVRDKEAAVRDKEELVKKHCRELHHLHRLTKELLLQMKGAGNKTDYMTPRTGAKTLNEEVKKANKGVAGTPKVESPSALTQKLRNGSAKVVQDKVSLAARFPEKYATLEKFYKFCNILLDESKPCPANIKYMSEEFVDRIRGTVRCIISWEPDDAAPGTYFRPSAVAQETMAVQPIIFAIIWKISAILGCSAHLTKEQFLPPQENKSKRWMDAMLAPVPKQHLFAALGKLMGGAIEIKPLSRQKTSFEKLVAKGADQILGHEGQLLWDSCFQFCGGLGRDGQTSGMVLTMASVQIMEAAVKNVGTEEVDFDLRDTGNLPLFSKKTTETLFHEYEDKEAVSRLFKCYEPADGEPPMAAGFEALVRFVVGHEDASAFEGDEWAILKDGNVSRQIQIGKFLGAGAFSCVHKVVVDNKSYVMKIAKDESQSIPQLERELEVLNKLNHPCLPVVNKESGKLAKLTVRQRCEQSTVRCLLLEVDVGITAREACLNAAGNELIKLVDVICTEIMNCLEYVHQEGFVHLDIQPSNIIVVEERDASKQRVRLIDWGCAATMKKSIEYRGCPPFSHENLLCIAAPSEGKEPSKGRKKKPEKAFDHRSLALTAACLLSGLPGVPWEGFNQWKVTKESVEGRKKQACSLIAKLPGETKKTLKDHLGVVEDKPGDDPCVVQPASKKPKTS